MCFGTSDHNQQLIYLFAIFGVIIVSHYADNIGRVKTLNICWLISSILVSSLPFINNYILFMTIYILTIGFAEICLCIHYSV